MAEPTDQQTTKQDRAADFVQRGRVMWLIEREMSNWTDADPPRHALSVLWGKVRDMTDADTLDREQMDEDQFRSTLSA